MCSLFKGNASSNLRYDIQRKEGYKAGGEEVFWKRGLFFEKTFVVE